jgi:putative OPT family oligopeptide transporter
VLVPFVRFLGQGFSEPVYPATVPISAMSANDIFRTYVRFVGVGAIATAGIFGIVKSLRLVLGSFSIAARTFRQGEAHGAERTDRDIPVMTMLIGVVLCALLAGVFFASLHGAPQIVLAGLGLTLLFSFFFTSVAANAIATTARNPVSGMTMLTIMVSSVVLLRFGLSGPAGMFFVMAIAGMVCTALSVSGQTITDLKTGYWLGSTPAVQQRVKFLGVLVAAIAAGLTIAMLARVFQFGEAAAGDARVVLAAPQASIMRALVEGFMNRQPVAYLLFAVGAITAVVLEMLRVPALTFALGMYLPLELNTPALVGGMLHHWVTTRSARLEGEAGPTMRERGVVIASGMMAGGALGGVLGAGLRLIPSFEESWIRTPFFAVEPVSQSLSLAGFTALCLYLVWMARRRPA